MDFPSSIFGFVSDFEFRISDFLPDFLYSDRRQENTKHCSLPHFTLHGNLPLVMLDDLLADRQAQACALGFALARGGFGGEEGLENLGKEFFGDAGAGIDDLNPDFGTFQPLSLDRDRSALAEHGMAGVDEQIQQNL